MSNALKFGFITILGILSAAAQPTIGGVVNAASYAQALQIASKPVGNNLIAQGSMFVIFGSGMGPAALTSAPAFPLTSTLSGTTVNVSANGQTVGAYVVYTSAGQIAAILPSTTPLGNASVTVTYNNQTSASYPISVVASGFGVFTQDSQGDGPAAVQIFTSPTASSFMGLTNSAESGDTLVIYGTGLGAISVADNTPPGAVAAGSNVTINIAGQTTTATYAGRSPNFPGLDQVNFVIPANVPAGCYIPAEITASGQPSNLFYLSIGSGSRTCTHPLGIPAASLAKLDAGSTANVGLFLMLTAVELGVPAQGTGGAFIKVNANEAFQLTNRVLYSFGGAPYPVASGSCAVLDSYNPTASFAVPDFSQVGGQELNAGAGLTISGSNGNSQGILHQDTGGYLAVFFATLGKGTWMLSGTGGPDVGAFTATTSLPDDLTWTNAGNFSSVPRGAVTVTWTGGNLNAQSLVTIFGSDVVVNPTDPSKNRGKVFYCNAPASAGQFVVPASVIMQMPQAANTAAGEMASGTLGISSGAGSPFNAPLMAGTLDAGYFAYGEAQTLTVTYQ